MRSTARIRAFPGNALLRRQVKAAAEGRPVCRECRRTPLVGERIHFYANGGSGSEWMVCDLCRPGQASAPVSSRLMHSPDSARAVRVLGSAA